jgi:hypothetical protein
MPGVQRPSGQPRRINCPPVLATAVAPSAFGSGTWCGRWQFASGQAVNSSTAQVAELPKKCVSFYLPVQTFCDAKS